MRQYRWFYLLLITGLLLSSCQSISAAVTNPDAQTASSQTKVDPLAVSVSAQNVNVLVELEESECLNCHSDKERLIETVKEEEAVEAESSGVG